MNKKVLIITAISIFIFGLLSTFSFATENGGVVGNVVSDATNVVEDGSQMVGNVVKDGADMVSDGVNMVDNTMATEGNMIENGVNSQTLNDMGGDAKNATETMTTDGLLSGNNLSENKFLGINLSVWLWIILIVIIIVIIILICKYMQNHDEDNNEDDE